MPENKKGRNKSGEKGKWNSSQREGTQGGNTNKSEKGSKEGTHLDRATTGDRIWKESGLGSGIPSLVGAFGSKVIKCGAGSSLSTSSASREGDRGDADFRSLLYGGRSLSYQECFGEAREDGLDRDAMLIPLFYR
ncbi:hypothetical protein Tco_1397692 [Tanacetum coccineum]